MNVELNVDAEFGTFSQSDFNLIVDFRNPEVSVSAFASNLRYTDANGSRVYALGTPADNRSLGEILSQEELRNARVRISISDDLELVMEFLDSGFALAALPEWEDETWSIRFERPVLDNVTFILCSSKGRLERYGPAE